MSNKVPVLFLIFDRKEVSVEAFQEIRKYQPLELYIAADGSRKNKPGETERCIATREAIINLVDWDCNVHTLFRDENLGCAKAVSEAISWFFESEESGVIIEDDVVVSQDFFKLCEEFLPFYAENERIMMITSQFLGNKNEQKPNRYTFSNAAYIWGWATWRRAWEKMDMSMSKWPTIGLFKLIKAYGLFEGVMYHHYYSVAFRKISNGITFNSWATRWNFSVLANNGLSMTPLVNLSKNIGCSGVGGAHYEESDEDPYLHLALGSIEWPVSILGSIDANKKILRIERRDFRRVRIIGLKKKYKKLLKN